MVNKKFCDDCKLEISPSKVWVIKIWLEQPNTANLEKYKHLCDTCQKRYKWMQE